MKVRGSHLWTCAPLAVDANAILEDISAPSTAMCCNLFFANKHTQTSMLLVSLYGLQSVETKCVKQRRCAATSVVVAEMYSDQLRRLADHNKRCDAPQRSPEHWHARGPSSQMPPPRLRPLPVPVR
jgi:hypothetical protein